MDLKRFQGAMLGGFVGDCLGMPIEGKSHRSIVRKFDGPLAEMKGSLKRFKKAGTYTDDTEMMIGLAEGLIEAKGVDGEVICRKFVDNFNMFRNYGMGVIKVVRALKKGARWDEPAKRQFKGQGSYGNGAAMRIAPVGYLYQNNPEKLKEVAHAAGICTHRHPAAEAACIGAAYLIKLALDRIPLDEMIPKVLDFTAGISCEFERALKKVEKCMKWCDEGKAISYLGEGLSVEEVVALAAYFFLKNPDDYEKTVVSAANTEGDSDSIACIAGAISGAYLGISTIREDWRTKIEKSQYLEMLARRLAESKTAGE